MAAAFGLTCCPSTLVPENKFSHNLKAHHGFIQKLSHHGGKTTAYAEKQIHVLCGYNLAESKQACL